MWGYVRIVRNVALALTALLLVANLVMWVGLEESDTNNIGLADVARSESERA